MISVIITTYGRPKKLKRAIASVLNQEYKNFEIIVVDDNGRGSDNQTITQNAIESYGKKVINYIPLEINKGANFARNIGIKASKGNYIALLDDDDFFYPDKLKKINEVIKESKESLDLIYSGSNYYHEQSCKKKYKFEFPKNIKKEILKGNFIGSNSFIVLKKTAIEKIGYFDETLKSCQDWDVWVRMIFSEGKIFGIDEALTEYTVHEDEGRITSNKKKRLDGHLNIFRKFEKYLDEFSEKEKKEIIGSQKKILAKIEYDFENFVEYRRIMNEIFIHTDKNLKDFIKYIFSCLKIKITENGIKKI